MPPDETAISRKPSSGWSKAPPAHSAAPHAYREPGPVANGHGSTATAITDPSNLRTQQRKRLGRVKDQVRPIRWFRSRVLGSVTHLVIVTMDAGRSPATPDGKSGISGTGEPTADMIGSLCVV
jgi:hypothetical protein